MTDCFALLGEPRRPWLDPESLKEKFHELSAAHHPDVAKTNDVDFSAINAAYNTLLDPKTRIKHLLELEYSGWTSYSPLQFPIPPEVTELFAPVARAHGDAAAFLKKKSLPKTPLETALFAPEKLELLAAMEDLKAALADRQQEVLARLKSLDETWPLSKPKSREPLGTIYQSLSYLGKWLGQVQEDLMRLKEN